MDSFPGTLLNNKRILITGGGTGLGKSMARRFLGLGAELVLCGRRQEVLEDTAAELMQETKGDVETIACDIRSADAVEKMMDEIWRRRPLDALVNNAGANFVAQTHQLSPRAIDSILNICLHGTAYCTIAAGRRWIEQGSGGVVLSILTLSALSGAPFTVPSAMAKAGVEAMTKSLAVEWGPKGIRMVAVAPGNFPTEGASARLAPRIGEHDHNAGVPLRRAGQHIELANLCAFLLSDLAAYITGETVVIDGGQRYLSGSRPTAAAMLQWSDEDWKRQRDGAPSDKARPS